MKMIRRIKIPLLKKSMSHRTIGGLHISLGWRGQAISFWNRTFNTRITSIKKFSSCFSQKERRCRSTTPP